MLLESVPAVSTDCISRGGPQRDVTAPIPFAFPGGAGLGRANGEQSHQYLSNRVAISGVCSLCRNAPAFLPRPFYYRLIIPSRILVIAVPDNPLFSMRFTPTSGRADSNCTYQKAWNLNFRVSLNPFAAGRFTPISNRITAGSCCGPKKLLAGQRPAYFGHPGHGSLRHTRIGGGLRCGRTSGVRTGLAGCGLARTWAVVRRASDDVPLSRAPDAGRWRQLCAGSRAA